MLFILSKWIVQVSLLDMLGVMLGAHLVIVVVAKKLHLLISCVEYVL